MRFVVLAFGDSGARRLGGEVGTRGEGDGLVALAGDDLVEFGAGHGHGCWGWEGARERVVRVQNGDEQQLEVQRRAE